MKRPDTETVKGMVGGGGGEHQQAVRVKAAQRLCRIHTILVSHINIKEHKVKPLLSCSIKEFRAAVKTGNCGVKGKSGELRLQSGL